MLALLLVAAGCASATRVPQPALPRDVTALAARRPLLLPFRAELGGRVRAEGTRGRFKAGLGAQPPDFRLDVFHPVTGTTLLALGVRQEMLHASWPESGECLAAPASPDLMERLLGLRIPPDELLPMLSGHLYDDRTVEILSLRHPPLAVAAGEGPVPGAGDRLLVQARQPVSGTLWEGELMAQRQGLALRGVRRDGEGIEIFLEYPRWRGARQDEPAFPGRVEVRVPAQNMRLDLEVKAIAKGGPPMGSLLPPLPAGCHAVTPESLPRHLPLGAAPDDGGAP